MDGTGIIWDMELVSRHYGVIFIPYTESHMRYMVSIPTYDDDADSATVECLIGNWSSLFLYLFLACIEIPTTHLFFRLSAFLKSCFSS